jgi:DNA-binding CsgD family transcriptional regulator
VRLVDLTGQLSNPRPLLGHLLDQDTCASGDQSQDEKRAPGPGHRPGFQTQRRLRSDEIAELVEAYRSGKAIKELASTFGVHRATVAAHLEAQGVTRRGLGQVDGAEAARLYESGWSSKQLGDLFGVSANTVLRSLRQAGVSIRRPRGG